MPLTNALGDAIQRRLDIDWPPGYEGASFEEQLTVLSTPLPFLEGHENTSRRALAEHITAQLARELDESASEAVAERAPTWLLQLVAQWHAERAIVLTFNYDTLVEHAVTTLKPSIVEEESAYSVHGSQIVYPAPRAAATVTLGDAAGPTDGSLQLLKLHGSLNWFWSLGDGSTLVRVPNIEGFGERSDHRAAALSGADMLDRFLIPPVLSKDSYYNVNLVHMLWRAAFLAIGAATRLTIIGYSMPQGDRIAADLLRQLPEGIPVDLVNWSIGQADEPTSPLGRACAVGMTVDGKWTGDNAVADYVADRLSRANDTLREQLADLGADAESVVATVRIMGSVNGPHSFVLYDSDGVIKGVNCDRDNAAANIDNSPIGAALLGLPFGTVASEDFYDGARLRSAIATDVPFTINLAGSEYVAVGVNAMDLGKWPVLELSVVPA